MTMLSALGLSHAINGVRLLPVGTVYDPFVLRAADQLNYACYQDARFILVGTPSGVTLAPEGGAHQSIAPPLVGMAQDGLAAFEPAFIDELAVILRWAFDYLQRDGERAPDPRTWLRDATGGSVYLRLSTRPVEQPGRAMTPGARAGGRRRRLLAAAARAVDRDRRRLYRRRGARGGRRRRHASPRPAARRRSSPSPRPTGSTPAGRRRSGRARPAPPPPAATSSG